MLPAESTVIPNWPVPVVPTRIVDVPSGVIFDTLPGSEPPGPLSPLLAV